MWYYAGSYKAFRLDDLSIKEWAQLSSEVRMSVSLSANAYRFFKTFIDYICHRQRNTIRKEKFVSSEYV